MKKLQYNSPFILTFFFASLFVLALDAITGGASTLAAFCVYRSPISPLFFVQLFGHVLGHSGIQHFLGNMTLLLVLGPPLEEKYGSKTLLVGIAFTAVTSGILQCILFPNAALLGASGIVFMLIKLISVILDTLLSFVGAPHLNAMVDKPLQNEGSFTVDASQTVKHVDQQNVEGFLFRLLSQFLDHVPLGRGNLGAGNAFLGLLCHDPPAVILCELPALNFLERDVIVVHLSFGGDPIGQRRTGRICGEFQLLRVKPAVVQPSLVCFRNLNWIAMIVNVVHFITSLLSCPDGWCIRTTQTIPN